MASCKVSVFTRGEVNLIENDSYEIEYECQENTVASTHGMGKNG